MSSASNTFGTLGTRAVSSPSSARRTFFGRRRQPTASFDPASSAVAPVPRPSDHDPLPEPRIEPVVRSATAIASDLRNLEWLMNPLPPLPPLPPAVRIDDRFEPGASRDSERHSSGASTVVDELWLDRESPVWAAELDRDPTVAATRMRLERHLAELSASVPDIVGALLATVDGLPMAATLADKNVERIAAMTASVASLSARAMESTGLGRYRETLVRCGDGCFVVYEAGHQVVLAVAARSCLNLGLIHLECRRAAQRFARLVQECGSA
jgi:predicted regulator of Ras-like GTPase activity (Roadblock/LC7/MglB family)